MRIPLLILIGAPLRCGFTWEVRARLSKKKVPLLDKTKKKPDKFGREAALSRIF